MFQREAQNWITEFPDLPYSVRAQFSRLTRLMRPEAIHNLKQDRLWLRECLPDYRPDSVTESSQKVIAQA
jgi:hypothetical protein